MGTPLRPRQEGPTLALQAPLPSIDQGESAGPRGSVHLVPKPLLLAHPRGSVQRAPDSSSIFPGLHHRHVHPRAEDWLSAGVWTELGCQWTWRREEKQGRS